MIIKLSGMEGYAKFSVTFWPRTPKAFNIKYTVL